MDDASLDLVPVIGWASDFLCKEGKVFLLKLNNFFHYELPNLLILYFWKSVCGLTTSLPLY
jgi:hypothetical protein